MSIRKPNKLEMWLLDNILEDYIKLAKLQNTKIW